MLVPAFLHGLFRDVKAACRRKVTQLKRGAEWADLAGDLVDTRDHEGLLVLDGPSPLMGGTPHFHFFAMAQAIENDVPFRLPESVFTMLFEPMIHTNWGLLVPAGQWGYPFLFPPGISSAICIWPSAGGPNSAPRASVTPGMAWGHSTSGINTPTSSSAWFARGCRRSSCVNPCPKAAWPNSSHRPAPVCRPPASRCTDCTARCRHG